MEIPSNYYGQEGRGKAAAVGWLWIAILLNVAAAVAYYFDYLPLQVVFQGGIAIGIVFAIWIINPFFHHQVAAVGFICVCIYTAWRAYTVWSYLEPAPLT